MNGRNGDARPMMFYDRICGLVLPRSRRGSPPCAAAATRTVGTIAVFNAFCNANGPCGEHGFEAFEAEGHTIFSRSTITTGSYRRIRLTQRTLP